MKYAKKVITNPTSAATIIFLADSIPDLSPPEVIHLIPPKTKNAKAIKDAAIKAIVITVEKTLPKVSPQRLPQLPMVGHVSIEFGTAGSSAAPRTEVARVK